MAEFTTPSEIAREVFRRLSAKRIQPTPENFSEVYFQISGTQPEEPFPDRHLRQIAAALPRATAEQLRIARQFEAACTERSWQSFKQQITALLAEKEEDTLPWANLIRDLQTQIERRQQGLNSITKHETLGRILDNSSVDSATLFSRLQGLCKGWAALPAIAGSTAESAVSLDSNAALSADLASAPELWRNLLADTLESALSMLLIDAPELATEATALSKQLRNPATSREDDNFSERLRQFSYKVQWIAQDQSYIRSALLNLLRLIIENIGELVVEDKYLQGQMTVLMELFSRPLDKGVIEELAERLRDVIYKQGSLKHSLTEAQERLCAMLADFVARLGELADMTGIYHGKVSVFAEQIAQASSLEELTGLVEVIVTETKHVEQRTRHSQDELLSLRVTVDHAHKEIARLEVELEQASELVRHDALTGALNRKGLDEMLARETARMQRRNTHLCLALLDVDDFKKLNDTFGHTTGDEALKHLSQVIRENIRPQDSAGRYGGEEFLIILPDTKLENAVAAMRRLQRELTKRIFLHENKKMLITFSAGVTEMQPDEAVQAAIDRADQAMYKAKKAGKNRVEADQAQPIALQPPKLH